MACSQQRERCRWIFLYMQPDKIEGKIDFDSANARISRYYEEKEERNELAEEKEADIVSARIAQLLSNKTFTFSPASYC